ncbi:DoxX family protein [Loktanella sp. S4079]|uniref:DoxX family protein n=1 Tax=Loktanella sp. S4079 TaxID=579483 RepID=UPI0005FA7AF0|nr:DoxX family membrane protein [Loktanella sp. S4079]KJZ20583.1 DoxX [Loktanella sp. S4079]
MLNSPLLSHSAARLHRLGDALLPFLARFIFAAVLLFYFWNSAKTKLGDGIFGFLSPSSGAYVQIFPRAMEAAGYDTSQLTIFHWAVVTAGTLAEFILPLLILVGLMTRLAALGMIGFIIVQSLTDLFGHGGIAHAGTLGMWFDRLPDGLILDQRAFWVFCLLTLVFKGAGAISIDRLIFRNAP